MFFGTTSWDPWLIVAQILCLQCLYYLTLGLFLSILVGTRVPKLTLVYFFDFATVTASTATGWCVMASMLLSSVAGAGFIFYIVERAKKCLDFCATLYIVHLLICIVYGGWPSSMTWWVVNITGLSVMDLLGEHLCMQRELREIPTARYRSNGRAGDAEESRCAALVRVLSFRNLCSALVSIYQLALPGRINPIRSERSMDEMKV